MGELKVTTLEQLKEYAKGQLVELPPFADGQPFVARIKRPSMIDMISSGRLPNALLDKATGLFMDGARTISADNADSLKDVGEIMEFIFESSFIEPSYKQIKESGVSLTDDQKMFLFNYSQMGVKALESFRSEQ